MKALKIILVISLLQLILTNYPEDYSTIDFLTNPENNNNLNYDEVFLGSYYHSSSSTALPLNDLRNGVKIQPKNIRISGETVSESCTTDINIATEYSENDDNTWTYLQHTNSFYPSNYYLIRTCFHGYQKTINLLSFINSVTTTENYDLSYIFYFWIHKVYTNTNPITFSCKNVAGNQINFRPNRKGLFLLYLKYNYSTKTFSDINSATSFVCPSMNLQISGTTICIKQIKLTTLIPYNKLKNTNCNNLGGNCPSSYYCDINTGECKKCLGIFRECQNRNIGLTCGRFTEEWQNTVTSQTSCTPDYFNLQEIGELSFGITPPIKSNAASLSFWIFTLIDIYESSDVNNINPYIFHISLEDFFVVTVIPGKTKYTIYLTAYQMYHEVYGYDIQKIKTKKEFIEIMNKFPYKNWFVSQDVTKMNRWVNTIVTFNKNVPRIGLQIFYRKSHGTPNYINYKNPMHSEYIYNNENNIYQSRLHFKRFYRNSDVMNLNINIYNNNIGVFVRKLYVYATELLITSSSDSEKLFGFQYIEYEKIFSSSNNLMPELVLAVPFDKINKLESVEGQYSIQYYMYDMTKIYNNRINKNLLINPGDIDESLYDYDSRLYRLNLLSEKNKIFSNPELDIANNNACNSDDYCYLSNYAYACRLGYVIVPSTHTCTNSNSQPLILVPGINAGVNNRGMLTEVCYSNINNLCSYNSLTQFSCASSSLKIFDSCLSTPLASDTAGYFYYSYFFKLPPIKINLEKIYTSYFIQFNFLYETNSVLRPKEEFKGKKIYLFYTDAFKIWHDYSMKYLGVEDNQGNPSRNLIPYFNTENENVFTISVTYDQNKDIYRGKIFLNGNKINTPSFTGEKLSYILMILHVL